ncbi:MAG: enoyl-CoA hydratase/isomerase family protein [Thermoleophilia bacterium]|nr:enoyl-CoA hydratase/isomerase family protein [Thermoleophilia bacterium]
MTSRYEAIRVTRDDAIAIVELDNPPLNVITVDVGRELKAACMEFAADESIRVVVFRSAHRGIFTAGADITMMARVESEPELLERFRDVVDVFDHVAALPMPTICQLEGIALGGGFELALACDFRIAGDDLSQLGLPEVRIGLLPGGGGTQRLPRLVGIGLATEMIMKGMRYDAQGALERGLVNEVVPADELVEIVEQRARSLARQAPRALRHIKTLIRASFEQPADAGLELERSLFRDLLGTSDAVEGIAAVTESRRPAFTGD